MQVRFIEDFAQIDEMKMPEVRILPGNAVTFAAMDEDLVGQPQILVQRRKNAGHPKMKKEEVPDAQK